jgi:DNA-binding HxlR family transcriptional regulator
VDPRNRDASFARSGTGSTHISSDALDAAARRVGDRWSLLVIAALLDGDRTFGELAAAVEGIAPTILTARLRTLQRQALLTAVPYERRPLRMRYALTQPGRRLSAAIATLAEWGAEHEPRAERPVHQACGTPIETRPWCPTCDRPVADEAADDLVWC